MLVRITPDTVISGGQLEPHPGTLCHAPSLPARPARRASELRYSGCDVDRADPSHGVRGRWFVPQRTRNSAGGSTH